MLKKNIISVKRNKKKPNLSPLCTTKLWFPDNPSKQTSEPHNKIINNKNKMPKKIKNKQ
jgi:hypothetical protein